MQSQSSRIIQKILNSELRDQSSIQQNNQNHNVIQDDAIQMVIELDSNRSATIKIHSDDDPLILAKAFCFQYSIDPRVINTLANNIKNVKNMEFNHVDINHHNKSKISDVFADKENNSTMINVSQSINQSFNNKGNRSTKNKSADKSILTKHDTTMMSNQCSRQTVFDRLYHDSRKKKVVKNCVNQSNRKDTNKKMSNSILWESNVSNPCLFIYDKNMKAHQASLIKRQQLFQMKQSKVTEGCTFKPQINPISEMIANKMHHSYRSEQNRQRDMKRIQQYLTQKQNKQIAQCTFEPKILSKSRERSKSAQRYKVLYEDSKLRQLNTKKSQEQLQMSRKRSVVKINKISQSIVGDKSFYQRLHEDQLKRAQKKNKIQLQIKEQKNRRPSTGRAPQNRPRNISIGQHLYNQGKNKNKQRQLNSMNSTIKNKLTCFKSDQIYQNTKKTAFQYIFALLDGNEDGLISHTKINISRLSHDVLIILTPLFIQLEQVQAQLDQKEFVEALSRLFNNLSVPDKQKILNTFRSKNRQFQQQHSFKPVLNQKSLVWASQRRNNESNLYDLWRQTQVQKQQKLQQIRTLKILEELSECTFHPRLFR